MTCAGEMLNTPKPTVLLLQRICCIVKSMYFLVCVQMPMPPAVALSNPMYTTADCGVVGFTVEQFIAPDVIL